MYFWVDETGLDCDYKGVNKALIILGARGPHFKKRKLASSGAWHVSGANAGPVWPFGVQTRRLGEQTWAGRLPGGKAAPQGKNSGAAGWGACPRLSPCPGSLLTNSFLYNLACWVFVFQQGENKLLWPLWTSSNLESWFSHYKWVNCFSDYNLTSTNHLPSGREWFNLPARVCFSLLAFLVSVSYWMGIVCGSVSSVPHPAAKGRRIQWRMPATSGLCGVREQALQVEKSSGNECHLPRFLSLTRLLWTTVLWRP